MKAMSYVLISATSAALLIYLLICTYIFFNQEKMIFFPPPPNPQAYAPWQAQQQTLAINRHQLHGWHVQQPAAGDTVILYFGGNAEDVVYNLYTAQQLHARQLFMFNYRGYGNSEGEPSQQALFTDALALYDTLVTTHAIDPQRLLIMGRSLGSSVATHLASRRANAGLILVTPFDSLQQIAAGYFSWLPVGLMLKHPFRTIDDIRKVKSPILILAADRDEVIPPARLHNLLEVVQQRSKLVWINDSNHQNISERGAYFNAINQFIAAHQSAP